MLCHGGAIEDAVTVGGPLDVAQPAWPVRVAHQVGVKGDRVIAGITYEQNAQLKTDDGTRCFVEAASAQTAHWVYNQQRSSATNAHNVK